MDKAIAKARQIAAQEQTAESVKELVILLRAQDEKLETIKAMLEHVLQKMDGGPSSLPKAPKAK